MFKPPKMFHLRTNAENVPPPPTQPMPEVKPETPSFPKEEERVWSPTSPVKPQEFNAVSETPSLTDTMETPMNTPEIVEPITDTTKEEEPVTNETIAEETIQETIVETQNTPISSFTPPLPQEETKEEDYSRYARPVFTQEKEETTYSEVSEDNTIEEPVSDIESNDIPDLNMIDDTDEDELPPSPEKEISQNAFAKILQEHKKVIRAPSLNSIPFADIWYTAEKIAYIRDKDTSFALIPFETDDMEDFYKALEQGYTGQSSYAIRFAGESYRVERIITLAGVQYNCRKMPGSVPDIYSLGLPKHTVDYLLTLGKESGLLLFGGPTGMGKTTSASALMKKFLEIEGGFMYTIEDPPEMPLEGLYRAQNGGLGLCKQCPVDNERWGDGIKSALRSRPRYILVGEIRTPETASQVLRAATSGHLVLSTIHASTVEDALESLIKYASGAGLTESLAADLLARGILGVIHQKLEGSTILRPVLTSAFANPHLTGGDQMRSLIRNNTINLQTLIEAQSSRMMQGRSIFGSEKLD